MPVPGPRDLVVPRPRRGRGPASREDADVSDPLPRTEQRNPASIRLGELSAADVVALMNKEEYQVLAAVEQATPLLARAAEQVAGVFGAGGRTVFIGSGTSGRIAMQEAAELPPTFGVPPDSFMAMAIGGALTGPAALTWNEDDVQAAPDALSRSRIGQGDAVSAWPPTARPPSSARAYEPRARRARGRAASPTIPARHCWRTATWGSSLTPDRRF